RGGQWDSGLVVGGAAVDEGHHVDRVVERELLVANRQPAEDRGSGRCPGAGNARGVEDAVDHSTCHLDPGFGGRRIDVAQVLIAEGDIHVDAVAEPWGCSDLVDGDGETVV